MRRTFEDEDGIEWEAQLTGHSHSVDLLTGSRITSHSIRFRPVDASLNEPVTGFVWDSDLAAISVVDLRKSLKFAFKARRLKHEVD